jgi:serine protease Do
MLKHRTAFTAVRPRAVAWRQTKMGRKRTVERVIASCVSPGQDHIMKRKALVVGWIALGIAGSTTADDSAGVSSVVHHSGDSAPRAAAFTTASAAPSTNALALPDFASVVARCAPAVVTISVTESELPSAIGLHVPHPSADSADAGLSRRSELLSPSDDLPMRVVGSGFIVSPEGVILTTAHLVNSARRIDVRLTDERELEAKLIGVDTRSDVAVLKVDATHLPTVKLGSSADIRVGDWVVAIGSPFGFETSVSRGIVSAKSRALPGRTYVPFIQTDVSVNPGDSGGPLIDMKGEVIGLDSHIASLDGGYQGLSFAIPIEIASSVATQLLQHGKVTRGKLGVSAQEMTQGLAESFGLNRLDGVLVSAVEPGGPAAVAGLEPGDVILALDDEEVASSIDLPARVAAIKPGTSIRLMVFHRGHTKALNVTIGRLRDTQGESADSER